MTVVSALMLLTIIIIMRNVGAPAMLFIVISVRKLGDNTRTSKHSPDHDQG